MNNLLSTFQLVYEGRALSPVLTTTREYGKWFIEVFGQYPAIQELYMKSKTKDGNTVIESHPGTRIGAFFDKTNLYDPELHSWFILQDSSMMERLKQYKLAELRDAIPLAVKEGKRMLRVYTVKQIEYYIRATLDKNFDISQYIGQSRKVCVKDFELDKLIKPEIKIKKNKLF